MRVDHHAARFSYSVNESAIGEAKHFDRKLVLLTNVMDFDAAHIVKRYKSVADNKRGFRVLKNDLEIAPVFLRPPDAFVPTR